MNQHKRRIAKSPKTQLSVLLVRKVTGLMNLINSVPVVYLTLMTTVSNLSKTSSLLIVRDAKRNIIRKESIVLRGKEKELRIVFIISERINARPANRASL